jgi:uncharacterized protein (UPF0332 family)
VTDEQTAFISKANENIRAAKLLQDDGLHNISVSRSYYAMFYLAEALLFGDGMTFSKHSAVIAAFGQRLVKAGRIPPEFHRFLIEAQESRNVGDYDIGPGLSLDDSTRHLDRAEQFLKMALSLLK